MPHTLEAGDVTVDPGVQPPPTVASAWPCLSELCGDMVPVGTTLQIWQKCIKVAEPELSSKTVREVEFSALQALEVAGRKGN